MTTAQDLETLAINTIRTLSIDAVEQANSGHPGLPMGAAPMAYTLWMHFLRHNPKNPKWANRDRFELSAGHGSMLIYSLLHLTGYEVSLDEIKNFRQWGSITPGHPEYHLTPGIETTTGPLGQGAANAVGMALAESYLAKYFNRENHTVVDHYTYVLASDGDLMEGVAYEAASLAGTLQLGRLIVLYDANHVTLSGTTDLTFTEDAGARFAACGWHVQRIDGHDPAAVDHALIAARAAVDRPSLIIARTHIGYGSPHKQDTWHAHGEPLGADEVRLTKHALGWPEDATFYVPDESRRTFRAAVERGASQEQAWRQRADAHAKADPSRATAFARARSVRPTRRYRAARRVTRKMVPFASSLTSSAPSRVTATPAGRPQALALSTRKPVMKSSYSPVGEPPFIRTRITLKPVRSGRLWDPCNVTNASPRYSAGKASAS